MAFTVGLPVAQLLWLCSQAEGVAKRLNGHPADKELVRFAHEAAKAVGVSPPDAVYVLDRQEANAFAGGQSPS